MSCQILLAQKYELGKVTLEELSEKKHPRDTSAVAAFLFKVGTVNFEYSNENGFEMVTNVKAKIKIYKKEGYDWANQARRYYIGSNAKETLNFKNAITYNLVDGKIEKTKLKGDGEFTEKVNKFWNRKKITMPNVKEGSIIEFEYVLRTNQIGTIDRWEFQSSIPVDYCEYRTHIPEFYEYNVDQKGYIFPKVTTEKINKAHSYTEKERSESNYRVNTSFENKKFEYQEQKTTHIIENVPALKDEGFVNNLANYISSIEHELSVIKYPNQPYKTFSTTWEAVTKTIYDNDDFGPELNKTGYFENDLATLLKDVNATNEKIGLIFNYVKSKVKWNDYYGYSCDLGVRKAYMDGVGNAADINLMLTAMLRYANVEANPILVSTRSNGINFFPNRSAFNYVICGVELEGSVVLLDATDPNSLPNILPIRDLNWKGRIIRKNGSSTDVDLMPQKPSPDVTNMFATISKDGIVEGKVREQHYDYNALVFRDRYGKKTDETYIESLEKRLDGIEVVEYNATGKNDLSQPVVENYTFKSTNSVEQIGDKLYFSPLLFLAIHENPFKQETREYPVDFAYSTADKYLLNITIPDGYVVESMPKSASIPMSDNLINVKYLISAADNKIQVSYTKDINSPIIPSDYYEELKAMFNEIVKKENEKIILKKI